MRVVFGAHSAFRVVFELVFAGFRYEVAVPPFERGDVFVYDEYVRDPMVYFSNFSRCQRYLLVDSVKDQDIPGLTREEKRVLIVRMDVVAPIGADFCLENRVKLAVLVECVPFADLVERSPVF